MSRSRYKIFKDDETPYFVTATTVNWLPLFSNPEIAKIIFDSLAFLQQNQRISIYAYVLMENHLHLIVSSILLAKYLAEFKSFTARRCIDYYQSQGNKFILNLLKISKLPHRTDRDYQYWQEGFHPKQIQNEQMLKQKIDYIHQNPVRRGYVDQEEHWRYSSARNFAGIEGMIDICLFD